MTLSPEDYGALYMLSLRTVDAERPRSRQSLEGQVGISDVFTCKERVRRMVVGDTDGYDEMHMAAWVGTAMHAKAAEDRVKFDPALLVEQHLVVHLPNGMDVPGTADEIDPREPSVTDVKSVDGLGVIRRTGSDDNQRSQRALYYGAAVQAGLVPEQGVARNIWLDRSGRYQEPHVEQEPYDPDILSAAAAWLDDVQTAVLSGESAERNPALCQFCRFSADRGGTCGADLIGDPRPLTSQEAAAAHLLADAREAAKIERLEQDDAKRYLDGVDGAGHGIKVWHTQVNATPPYVKTNVRRIPRDAA